MTTLLISTMAVIIFVAYILQTRALSENRAQCQILREREAIASRLLFECYRKLEFDTKDSYINKHDVLPSLITVLQIYDRNKHPAEPSVVCGLPSADSAEGV